MIKTMISIMQMEENKLFLAQLEDLIFDDSNVVHNLSELEEFFDSSRGSMEVIKNIRKYKVNRQLEDYTEYDFVIFTDAYDKILYFYLGSDKETQPDYVNTNASIIGDLIVFSTEDMYNRLVGIIDTVKATCSFTSGYELALV